MFKFKIGDHVVTKDITFNFKGKETIIKGGKHGIIVNYDNVWGGLKYQVKNLYIEDSGDLYWYKEDQLERFYDSIKLKRLNLTGVDVLTQDIKLKEELDELKAAILKGDRENQKEEICDIIQVLTGLADILEIRNEELAEYWENKHMPKMCNRPRNKKEEKRR